MNYADETKRASHQEIAELFAESEQWADWARHRAERRQIQRATFYQVLAILVLLLIYGFGKGFGL